MATHREPIRVSEFSDDAARRGSVVSYRVRAINNAGESAYSYVARVNS